MRGTTSKKFVPFYGTPGGKPSNGAGWGGEPPTKKLSTKKKALDMLKRGMLGKKK